MFNFFLFRVLPGDPAKALAPRRRIPARAGSQVLRERFGLGKPLPEQFGSTCRTLLSGDLGISLQVPPAGRRT